MNEDSGETKERRGVRAFCLVVMMRTDLGQAQVGGVVRN